MRSSPFPFCQSIQRVFLQTAEISTFSKVRICEAQHSIESPSGAFKLLTGACAANLDACFMTDFLCAVRRKEKFAGCVFLPFAPLM